MIFRRRTRTNVDHVDEPFTHKPGDKPVFSRRDIDDLIAFLQTLNDGYARDSGGEVIRAFR